MLMISWNVLKKNPLKLSKNGLQMKCVIYLINVKNSQGKRFHFYSIIVWHLFEYLSNMLIISALALCLCAVISIQLLLILKILREFDNETHISKCISNLRYHFHFYSRMLKSLSLALMLYMLYLLVEPCTGCYITEQYIPDNCYCTDDYKACNRNCEDYCLGEKCTRKSDVDGQKYCYKKCNRTLLFCVMACLGKHSQSFYEKLCEKNKQDAIKYTLKFD